MATISQTYFPTFGDAVQAAKDQLGAAGGASEELENHLWTGGIYPGQTARCSFYVDCLKGKNTRKGFHISIYRRDDCSSAGQYELTAYLS